jgi:hypothetical protein
MGFDLEERLSTAVQQKALSILAFFRTTSNRKEILQIVQEADKEPSSIGKYWAWLPIIINFFRENVTELMLTVPVSLQLFFI